MNQTPVVTIDGPSGTGKGTIAALVAERLGWHTLDSGALYRVLGLAATRAGIDLDDAGALAVLAAEPGPGVRRDPGPAGRGGRLATPSAARRPGPMPPASRSMARCATP